MEMVEVHGLHIAYERAGSGPALVLLHGYVGDGPTTWRRQLDALSDEFTVVAWDAPGADRSTDPPERFGLRRHTRAGPVRCLPRSPRSAFVRRSPWPMASRRRSSLLAADDVLQDDAA
jgi:pimeloyl-ACP methyl ester carboxylesterase